MLWPPRLPGGTGGLLAKAFLAKMTWKLKKRSKARISVPQSARGIRDSTGGEAITTSKQARESRRRSGPKGAHGEQFFGKGIWSWEAGLLDW